MRSLSSIASFNFLNYEHYPFCLRSFSYLLFLFVGRWLALDLDFDASVAIFVAGVLASHLCFQWCCLAAQLSGFVQATVALCGHLCGHASFRIYEFTVLFTGFCDLMRVFTFVISLQSPCCVWAEWASVGRLLWLVIPAFMHCVVLWLIFRARRNYFFQQWLLREWAFC